MNTVKEIFVRTKTLHFGIVVNTTHYITGDPFVVFDIYSAGKSHFDQDACFYTKGGLPVDSFEDADHLAHGNISIPDYVLYIDGVPNKEIEYAIELFPRFDDDVFENIKEVINREYLKKIYDEVSV